MKNKWIYWCGLITLIFLCLPITAWAADNPVGVAYRGHIQDLGDYPRDGSWVDSPEIIGTVGQSKRIEGFEIKLTGTVPEGMELRYNAHVQNKGWLYNEDDPANWPKDGAYAGTRGDSLRIEAVKIVLTDRDGKAIPGYSVQYRGHVQNVGDLPKAADQWLADGAQLGTVGSSLRLEALLVQVGQKDADLSDYTALMTQVDQLSEADYTTLTWAALENTRTDHPVTVKNSQTEVDAAVKAIQAAYDGLERKNEPTEPQVYDRAGTYGPDQGSETIAGDVTIAADGVVLQNLVIAGNLTISEAVGDGNVTLNNVTVKGDTFVRGGGIHSIKINGGKYSRIIMEKTASGAVRIMALNVDGIPFIVSEAAAGETIILEGTFESVTVNAPNMTVTTQGATTTIGKMTVSAEAAGSTVTVAAGTTVTELVLDGKAAIKGQGNVAKAEVKADGVVFEKKPGAVTVEPDVDIPPVFPTPDSGGGSTIIPVTAVSLNKTALSLSVNTSETLIATVNPVGASNKVVSWTSCDGSVATVGSDGTVTGIAEGNTVIVAFTQDGNKSADCIVTVKDLKPTIDGITVPFAGESPVTTIAATSQYSGMVSWQKKDGSGLTALTDGEKFDGTSTYLATITLSLNPFIYTEADITADFFKVAGATATNNAGGLAITAEFVATEQYRITNDGIITAYSGSGGDLAVLATVNHTAVTGIGENAFKNQAVITAITLPTTVAAIGDAAFAGCTGLTAVTFTAPSALKSIGVSAFDGCTALAKIAIPQSVTAIANATFESCSKLTAVTFDDAADLNTIGDAAFCNCQLLQSIAIPDSVTSIGLSAFQDCPKLTAITFRGAAPSLGADAIAAGTIIKYYENYSDFTTGAWAAYPQAIILAKPVLNPPTVTNSGTPMVELSWGSIPRATGYQVDVSEHSDLSTATSVTVSEAQVIINTGLAAGKSYYFAVKARDAYGVSVPSVVTPVRIPYPIPVTGFSINSTQLHVGNTGQLSATFTPTNATHQKVSWSSYNPTTATVDAATGVITAVAPGTTTMEGITEDGGFKATCSVMVTPVPVDSVTLDHTLSVGVSKTAQLTTTVEPANASGVNVTWASSDQSIATVDNTGQVKGVKEGSANITATAVNAVGSTTSTPCAVTVTTSFEVTQIEDGIGRIDRMNGSSTNIAIPETIDGLTITTIRDGAFLGSPIEKVTIPKSVETIGNSAFMGCSSLNSVTFAADSNLETIGSGAFQETNIFAVAIPKSVKTIGSDAFNNCQSLNSVTFAPESILETIGIAAFAGSGVRDITLPEKVKTIPDRAFAGCGMLTTVTLPSGLTAIGAGAFKDCTYLGDIEIPKGVVSIGADAFNGCKPHATTGQSELVLSFDGNAPGTVGTTAFPAGTTFAYWEGKTGFNTAPWKDSEFTLKLRNAVLTQTAVTISTASFSFAAQPGATEVKLQQKVSTDSDWSDATTEALTTTSTTATATGLSSGTGYNFRLLISDGDTPRPSQVVNLTTDVAVAIVTLTPLSLEMRLNGSSTLAANVYPTNATNKSMNWTTSNSAVATVNVNTSVIIAEGAGTATITATAADGSGKSDSCLVTVLPYSYSEDSEQVTINNYLGSATTVAIPERIGGKPVVAIGASAFASKTTLTEVTIPATVTTIAEDAFKDNPITTITIPANVTIAASDQPMGTFSTSFMTAYPSGSGVAGTYSYNSGTSAWTKN